MDTKLEIEIIKQFVKPEKRQRCIEFVSNPKTRSKVFKELRDAAIFDPRYVTELTGAVRTTDLIVDKYKTLGMGGRVYVMSEHYEWDGNKYQMSYIVGVCLATCIDVLGYCWKTKTAFYEWHHSEISYFLKRPTP